MGESKKERNARRKLDGDEGEVEFDKMEGQREKVDEDDDEEEKRESKSKGRNSKQNFGEKGNNDEDERDQ